MGHDIFNSTQDALALSRKFYEGHEEMDHEDVFCVVFSVGATNETAGLMAICFPEGAPEYEERQTLLKELGCNEDGLVVDGVIPLWHYEEIMNTRDSRETIARLSDGDFAFWDTTVEVLISYGASNEAVALARNESMTTLWHVAKGIMQGNKTRAYPLQGFLRRCMERKRPSGYIQLQDRWQSLYRYQLDQDMLRSLMEISQHNAAGIIWIGQRRLAEVFGTRGVYKCACALADMDIINSPDASWPQLVANAITTPAR